jgi:hypothetical protein
MFPTRGAFISEQFMEKFVEEKGPLERWELSPARINCTAITRQCNVHISVCTPEMKGTQEFWGIGIITEMRGKSPDFNGTRSWRMLWIGILSLSIRAHTYTHTYICTHECQYELHWELRIRREERGLFPGSRFHETKRIYNEQVVPELKLRKS